MNEIYSYGMLTASTVMFGFMFFFKDIFRRNYGSGILSHLGNWLLQVSLVTLPASAQYPFVTGGTIIVSTIISLFTDKKPSIKEICAVLLAFVGLILLFVLPEIKIF